jgi:hypothetical protein
MGGSIQSISQFLYFRFLFMLTISSLYRRTYLSPNLRSALVATLDEVTDPQCGYVPGLRAVTL